EVRSFLQEQLVSAAKSFGQLDGIAGVATAGIAHGALLADRLGLPFIYIRSKAKAHGRQNQIEGELKDGGRYLVIEDLISTGGSSLQAVEALRQAGGKAVATLALFTYGFDEAAAAFQRADCPVATLSNYPALLEEAVESGYITAAEQQMLADWRENPVAWSEQFEQ
ncbi:MAG: orotate phosphoribosyltransferase, partial [Bacteroidota bacterium]